MEDERANESNGPAEPGKPDHPDRPNLPRASPGPRGPNQVSDERPARDLGAVLDPTVMMDLPPAVAPQAPPSWIAGYRMIRKLGEGGMGVVYEVEQQSPRRSVALKVIRGGPFLDEHSIRLFHREAQTLARLKHPGIAAIHEAGRTESGQRFFTMELVPGIPLDRYLRSHPSGESELRSRTRDRTARDDPGIGPGRCSIGLVTVPGTPAYRFSSTGSRTGPPSFRMTLWSRTTRNVDSIWAMSARGSPSMTKMSASRPGAMEPSLSSTPNHWAG